MLPAITRGLFNMDGESHESRTTKFSFAGHASSNKSSAAVGLRILIQISQGKSNIVLKSALRLSRPTSRTCLLIPRISSPESYCFLKSCYLCNKELSPNKDVYMYRGDQGFCSAECRSRQIGMDEMKEIETSTKKMLASFRHFRTTGRCETRVLVEELRQRRKPFSRQKNGAIIFS